MCERVFIFMNTLEYKPLCTIHEYEYKPSVLFMSMNTSGCAVFMILNMYSMPVARSGYASTHGARGLTSFGGRCIYLFIYSSCCRNGVTWPMGVTVRATVRAMRARCVGGFADVPPGMVSRENASMWSAQLTVRSRIGVKVSHMVYEI